METLSLFEKQDIIIDNKDTMKLLILSTTLDPWDDYTSIKIEDTCKNFEKLILSFWLHEAG